MTILVTGGAGFIGSHVCERLLAQGHRVLCLDNFNDFYDPRIKEANLQQATQHSNFALVRGDILDQGTLEHVFSHPFFGPGSKPPEVVVHLAALAGVSPSLASPGTYLDVDTRGTVQLLEQARLRDVRAFIFGSSSSVYGVNAKLPFSEDDATEQQVSPYAVAKKAAELYCTAYHRLYRLPITILRFFTVYGPRQRPEMAIHAFTRILSRGQAVPVYGNGGSTRDYTYVDDVVDGVVAAIHRSYPMEIFNLGNSHPISLTDLVFLIAQTLKVEPRMEHLTERPGDVPTTCADISKAGHMLGYHPKVSIQEGVQRFVAWFERSQTATRA
jgi:UDP-glucuronate 4-epimerase